MSESFGYTEVCKKSHEFLRRGCSYSPSQITWAGDIVVTGSSLLKQSEVRDMRGEAGDVEYPFAEVGDTGCGGVTAEIPSQYSVEETNIRSGGAETFNFHTPKNPDPDDEQNWSLGLLESLSECGEMMDGGDALQSQSLEHSAVSICGTINRSSGVFEAQAHYLDNRRSYPDDPDMGLLVAIRTGGVWIWELRYAPAGRPLVGGLAESDNVSDEFTAALAALGMTHEDVYEFGMI